MAKKKMCEYYKYSPLGGYNTEKCMCGYSCPKNTNSKCEIITPKKKDVVIKAWAYKYKDDIKVSRNRPCLSVSVPCSLHIKASEYAKIKGDK